jgi:hypothetical protein
VPPARPPAFLAAWSGWITRWWLGRSEREGGEHGQRFRLWGRYRWPCRATLCYSSIRHSAWPDRNNRSRGRSFLCDAAGISMSVDGSVDRPVNSLWITCG